MQHNSHLNGKRFRVTWLNGDKLPDGTCGTEEQACTDIRRARTEAVAIGADILLDEPMRLRYRHAGDIIEVAWE